MRIRELRCFLDGLKITYTNPQTKQAEYAAATNLTVFRKQADGSWKVVEEFEVRGTFYKRWIPAIKSDQWRSTSASKIGFSKSLIWADTRIDQRPGGIRDRSAAVQVLSDVTWALRRTGSIPASRFAALNVTSLTRNGLPPDVSSGRFRRRRMRRGHDTLRRRFPALVRRARRRHGPARVAHGCHSRQPR